MRYSPALFSAVTIFVAQAFSVGAGDPEKLTRACPRLEPINGAPAGATIIDNETVLRLAKEGRFAAVAIRQTPIPATQHPPLKHPNSLVRRWRAEYRRSVAAIHTTEHKLKKAENDLIALEAKYFSLRKAVQRMRLQPSLDAKAEQIAHLKKDLRHAQNGFSRTVRQARLEGAQPGWFRDLKRP